MRLVRVACVALAWGALCTSSTLHAQARPPALEAPGIQYAHQEWAVSRDMADSNPCIRYDRYMVAGVKPSWGTAGIAICVGRLRARAVALAWAKGLDEHGVQLDAAARAKKLAELEIWLRRLAGKFRIDGTATNPGGSNPAHGSAECFGIGGGPGVSCVVAATWKAPRQSLGNNPDRNMALYGALQPLVMLLGIDPDAMEIRATLFELRAVPMRGVLVDGAVILEHRSPPERLRVSAQLFVGTGMSQATYEWRASRVAIKPRGDLDMKFLMSGIELDLQLHRQVVEGAVDSGVAP